MDAKQNPPSENDLTLEQLDSLAEKLIDQWTIEEKEEFFASQDAVTGLLGGGVATNWTPSESLPPITLSGLQETYADFEEKFFRGIHITSIVPPEQGWPIVAHCEICKKTVIVLSPWAIKPEQGDYWKLEGTCLDGEEHIKHNMWPQKLYPWDNGLLKFQVHDPFSPQDFPSMVEIVQEMSIDEAKRRWPDTPVKGEENK